MIMTGTVMPDSASRIWTSKPLTRGMCRSSTMQSGRRVERDSSNSAPDGNVSTSIPAERIRRLNALRIGSSSSTTAIKDRVLVTMAHCKWRERRKILDLGLLDFGLLDLGLLDFGLLDFGLIDEENRQVKGW